MRPYGGRIDSRLNGVLVGEEDYAVEMIRHDNKFVQDDTWANNRRPEPFLPDDLAKTVQGYLISGDRSEQANMPVSDKGYEISAWSGVVETRQADGVSMKLRRLSHSSEL